MTIVLAAWLGGIIGAALTWHIARHRAAAHHVAGHVRGFSDGWNAAVRERSRLEYETHAAVAGQRPRTLAN